MAIKAVRTICGRCPQSQVYHIRQDEKAKGNGKPQTDIGGYFCWAAESMKGFKGSTEQAAQQAQWVSHQREIRT